MKWYYSIRGNASNHGLVEEQDLFEMAKSGRLKPTDLVWNRATGAAWVQASTIQGLFPPEPPPSASSQTGRKRGFSLFHPFHS